MKIKALESKNIEGVMYQEGKEYEIENNIKELKYEEVKNKIVKEVTKNIPKKKGGNLNGSKKR